MVHWIYLNFSRIDSMHLALQCVKCRSRKLKNRIQLFTKVAYSFFAIAHTNEDEVSSTAAAAHAAAVWWLCDFRLGGSSQKREVGEKLHLTRPSAQFCWRKFDCILGLSLVKSLGTGFFVCGSFASSPNHPPDFPKGISCVYKRHSIIEKLQFAFKTKMFS